MSATGFNCNQNLIYGKVKFQISRKITVYLNSEAESIIKYKKIRSLPQIMIR